MHTQISTIQDDPLQIIPRVEAAPMIVVRNPFQSRIFDEEPNGTFHQGWWLEAKSCAVNFKQMLTINIPSTLSVTLMLGERDTMSRPENVKRHENSFLEVHKKEGARRWLYVDDVHQA